MPKTRRPRGLPLLLAGLLIALAPAALRAEPAPAPGPTTTSPGLGQALGPSGPRQLALVEHLRRQGFLFYGAWWCPACFRQKSLFGEQAGQRLPYLECDREEAGHRRCDQMGIRAYPTWVHGGERREGVLSLEELSRWSGWSAGDQP